MAVNANRVSQNALDKIKASPLFRGADLTDQLQVFVRAICEAVCEEVPYIEDVGATPTAPNAPSHK